jgi:hypothetical protein
LISIFRKRENFLLGVSEQEKELNEDEKLEFDSQIELFRDSIEKGKVDSLIEKSVTTPFVLIDFLVQIFLSKFLTNMKKAANRSDSNPSISNPFGLLEEEPQVSEDDETPPVTKYQKKGTPPRKNSIVPDDLDADEPILPEGALKDPVGPARKKNKRSTSDSSTSVYSEEEEEEGGTMQKRKRSPEVNYLYFLI